MKRGLSEKNIPRVVTVLINIVLLISVFFLMNHVQALLDSDVKINLTEVVNQNRDVITSKLGLEMYNVEMTAKRFSDRLDGEQNPTVQRFNEVLNEVGDTRGERMFVTTTQGLAIFQQGERIDVSNRNYFTLSMLGDSNISNKVISRLTNKEVFIFSVPLRVNGVIVGTLQDSYSLEQMNELCSLSLFSAKGFVNIVDEEGYVLVSSQEGRNQPEKDNFYRQLQGAGNRSEMLMLEENLKGGKAGFFEATLDKENVYSAYTPINGIHGWYLITSVAQSAVSPNSNIVIMMFSIILLVMVLVFGCSMLYFFSFKQKQQSNIERVAFVDKVTNGNTYAKFILELERILRTNPNGHYSILKFDIDNFKFVNNYYGFDKGDQVLRKTYHKVQRLLFGDEMICRIASDNFVVLLKNADENRVESLMNAVESDDGLVLYFSSGVYNIEDHNENISKIVDKASLASHNSKGSLIKKVEFYDQELDNELIRKEQMKRSIKQALKEGLIVPFYQPKVDVNTGEIVGAEALARWITKEGEVISPAEFIPISEQSGLITELDMHVFRRVVAFQKERLETGKECVPISVNFSRNHLYNRNFISIISNYTKEQGVPASLLEVEITESAFFNNLEMMNAFVEELHKAGFMVSMDDFGSGYSSLNMLKDVQIDVLKIDRGFLIETGNSEKQKIIFTAISQMAQQLDIKVVVEGVETKENIAMMKLVGCSIAQGYFYAKPMSKAAFEEYLNK